VVSSGWPAIAIFPYFGHSAAALSVQLDHLSACWRRRLAPADLLKAVVSQGRNDQVIRTRVLALTGCAAGLLLAVPAAHAADEAPPAVDSAIQAETGQVLAETVNP
jgi:hypothetical protein